MLHPSLIDQDVDQDVVNAFIAEMILRQEEADLGLDVEEDEDDA